MRHRNFKRLVHRAYIAYFCLFVSFGLEAKVCKEVDDDWKWFSDHAVGTIKYAVAMPKGEKIIVGTGIMLLGKPRGSIYEGVKPFDIVAYGFGALHIRSHSGKPIRVCVDSGEVTALKLYEMEF